MHTLQISMYILAFLIALALLFDFMNGFHDAANAIATVVSTGVLKPQTAVVLAAFFNFVAILIFQLKVASTVGKGTIDPNVIDHYVVFGALIGAIFWNFLTWCYGIPSSSSHALIGGLIGAASMYSLGYGGNDAQKTMGIIWMLLIASGYMGANDSLPIWVIISCYSTISLGTLFGGWRIVKTMEQRITKLKPVGGFCAESGAAVTLFLATALGVPVSTTHTITGAIVGVGSVQKMSAVRWGVAGNIVWAWIFTIPASAFVAAIAWWIGTKIL